MKIKFKHLFFTLFLFFFSGFVCKVSAQDNLKVLNWLQYSDAPNSLYHHLTDEAYRLLDEREKEIAQLKTTGDWLQRQQKIKRTIWEVVGEFPEKTPLNAKITGKIKKDGYIVENLIYESLPGFHVTASLFIPDKRQKPAPAILFCTGHSNEAYRRDIYQLPLLNLVKKGFVVLAFDPPGQGERLQYFNFTTGKSDIGSSTKEHSYPSVQTALLGQSVARYFIWDGVRGIDYLTGRKEVDPNRIGVHGLSGGGTQTAYISALDDRVAASAPACYITSFRRLMESIGVQDGEQNFFHGILRGIDHADFIEACAPKPVLIMATTNDFFNIQGVYETFSEIKNVYNIFGKPENISLAEDDHVHGYTKKNREAMYGFFQKHLNLPGTNQEEEVDFLTAGELQKTSTGQLATSLDSETVFSLNLKESGKYIENLEQSRKTPDTHIQKVIATAKKLSGYEEPSFTDKPVFTGRIAAENYVIEKYFIKGEGNYVLPYLLYVPEKQNGKGVVFLHPKGKNHLNEKTAEWFVNKGFTLLVPDLPGVGELGDGRLKGDAYINNVSYNLLFTAMQIGKSIVGIQAADVVKLFHVLKRQNNLTAVYGFSFSEMAPVLLHAAAFNPVISQVILLNPYSSYQSFVENRFYKPDFVYSLVPGALTSYDLPDLAAALAPRKLFIAGATDCNGKQVNIPEIEKYLKITEDIYKVGNADKLLRIVALEPSEEISEVLDTWYPEESE